LNVAKKSEDDLGDIDLESASKSRSKGGTKLLKEPTMKVPKTKAAPAPKSGGAKFKAPKVGKISVPKAGGGGIKIPHAGKASQPSGAFKLRQPERPKLKARRGRG
jgi:hypothetical protein